MSLTTTSNNASTLGMIGHAVSPQARLWPENTEMLIAVTRAANGRVVRISQGEGYLAKTWVVGENDDLLKTIAAAIVELRLREPV